MNKADIVKKLYEIESVKLGSFTLKSGATSPIYIDMRQIISYPRLLSAIANLMWEKVKHLKTDLLCGVPYTALPIATCLSLQHDKPMVMVRKEAKSYGTKKMVEGRFKPNQSCLIIEDVVTSGSSIITTLNELKAVELPAPYAVSFLDRQQGGKETLANHHCQLFSVFTLKELLTELDNSGIKISKEILMELNLA